MARKEINKIITRNAYHSILGEEGITVIQEIGTWSLGTSYWEEIFLQDTQWTIRTHIASRPNPPSFIYLNFRRQWHPTPGLLPGKPDGQRSLEGWSPWGHWGLDTTERLHFHFSLSSNEEGNGNPLQYSCLENPRDRGAWWAAVYGVAQSRTRLKGLSSSSMINSNFWYF